MNDEINLIELGKRIRKAREKAKFTQYQLAEKTGISTTQLSAYENGKKNIGLYSISRISVATGVTMDEIYFGDNELKPIHQACNEGELVANCISVLVEKKILSSYSVEMFYPQNVEGFPPNIAFFCNHYQIINDLILKLLDFEDNKNTYPDPLGFKKQIISSAASRINLSDNINNGKY